MDRDSDYSIIVMFWIPKALLIWPWSYSRIKDGETLFITQFTLQLLLYTEIYALL